MDFNEMNEKVTREFRANQGRVGGYFEGKPMVLLHTNGAKTGAERINPLIYLPDGDRILVFASKGGAPDNPDWYYNLVANPDVTLEVGTETYPARATVITGEERDRLYAEQVRAAPQFGDYAGSTTRTIPVIALERAG